MNLLKYNVHKKYYASSRKCSNPAQNQLTSNIINTFSHSFYQAIFLFKVAIEKAPGKNSRNSLHYSFKKKKKINIILLMIILRSREINTLNYPRRGKFQSRQKKKNTTKYHKKYFPSYAYSTIASELVVSKAIAW